MSTAEVAAHLGVHEKQVYRLLKRGVLPGTRITGTWRFDREQVDAAVRASAASAATTSSSLSSPSSSAASAALPPLAHARAVVVAGEDDPLWDEIADAWNRGGGAPLARAPATLEQALVLLARGAVDGALVEHAPADACRSPVDAVVRRAVHDGALVRLPLVRRVYCVAAAKKRWLESATGLCFDVDASLAIREDGSASRTLLSHLLLREGNEESVVRRALARQPVVGSHRAGVDAVLAGDVDAAFVPLEAARRVGLHTRECATLELSLVALASLLTGGLAALPALLATPRWRDRLDDGAGTAVVIA